MTHRAGFAFALPFLSLAIANLVAQTSHADGAAAKTAWIEPFREPAARLVGEAVSSTFAWQRLSVLTDTIGHRLSGSAALDRAIRWAVDEMKRDGLENVHTERVMVPKWVRGNESAAVVDEIGRASCRERV